MFTPAHLLKTSPNSSTRIDSMKQGLPNDLQQQVHIALQEDLSPSGCLNAADDLSAQLVPASARMHAEIIAREPGILCGCAWVDAVFAALGNTVAITQTTSTGWPATSSSVGSPRPTKKTPIQLLIVSGQLGL